jgi:hypothetical protein
MHWQNQPNDICCHIDGEYFKHFNGRASAIKHFDDHGYKAVYKGKSVAVTGCIVEEYTINK